MKKILLVLLTLGIIFSCGKKEEAKTDNADTKTETTTTAEPAKEEALAAGATVYSVPEVQKYIEDYKALLKEYAAAVDAKDEAKITELGDKIHELTVQEAEFTVKLTDNEEAQKFSDELGKLDEEFDALAEKAE